MFLFPRAPGILKLRGNLGFAQGPLQVGSVLVKTRAGIGVVPRECVSTHVQLWLSGCFKGAHVKVGHCK